MKGMLLVCFFGILLSWGGVQLAASSAAKAKKPRASGDWGECRQAYITGRLDELEKLNKKLAEALK